MHENTKKVLFCVGSLNVGGIETWLLNLLRLKNKELEIDFFVKERNGFYEEEILNLGSKIYGSGGQNSFGKVAQLLSFTSVGHNRALSALLSTVKYDVVHAHGSEFMGDIMKIAFRAGVKIRVAHCHTTGINKFNGSLLSQVRGIRFRTIDRKRLLQYSTNLLSCSVEAGAFLLGEKWFTSGKSKVLYCGVPASSVLNDNFQQINKESFGIPKNSFVIGHVGSMGLNRVKNHSFILKVMCQVLKRDKNVYLFLAGDGPLRESIEEEVENLGIGSNVIVAGNCDNVREIMKYVFDVNFLPSLYEGLPLVIVEAISSGLHTVCSNTITADLSYHFSERITAISLDDDLCYWVDNIFKAFHYKINHTDAEELVANSIFSIDNSYYSLLNVYKSNL
ncbi:hypothetical protein VHA01S_032_00270 [Vibrio halioticoli NBRC 102217]|uniref:Glycosyltransferase n=1 Tax=Vibrio halioticoli NBRC 102217 TaxID=1219072 RepID=V5FMK8_9VIBR|nr:glycosyltransferase [Vibrio halioticoli]GAD90077.1 hypothetical protein VHA01S_032_00270 [Vibrio halioticoli NBRC 102217]